MDDKPPPITLRIDHPDLLVGLLLADEVTVGPAPPGLRQAVDREIAARVADAGAAAAGDQEPCAGGTSRAAVRDLLRRGGYKPTGRGKPSSEYIANAALRHEFPRISNVVDIANLVSLESGLPVSLLDLDRSLGGARGLEIRFGRPGESFVFNASGQVIDVSGLVCVARLDGPAVGNPVKDAMESKTRDDTRRIVAVVYGLDSPEGRAGMARTLARFSALVASYASSAAPRSWMLPAH